MQGLSRLSSVMHSHFGLTLLVRAGYTRNLKVNNCTYIPPMGAERREITFLNQDSIHYAHADMVT